MVSQWQFCVTKPKSCINSKDKTREHLNYVIQFYEQTKESLSITQAAKLCAVLRTTLYHKINGYHN